MPRGDCSELHGMKTKKNKKKLKQKTQNKIIKKNKNEK